MAEVCRCTKQRRLRVLHDAWEGKLKIGDSSCTVYNNPSSIVISKCCKSAHAPNVEQVVCAHLNHPCFPSVKLLLALLSKQKLRLCL